LYLSVVNGDLQVSSLDLIIMALPAMASNRHIS
jgi:hypothetical protein